MRAEWKEGQEVTVRDGGFYKRRTIRKVTRVLKRYIILDDGSKWQDGYGELGPYPRPRGYHYPTASPTTDDDREWIRRESIVGKLERARLSPDKAPWEGLSLGTLEAMLELATKCRATAPAPTAKNFGERMRIKPLPEKLATKRWENK